MFLISDLGYTDIKKNWDDTLKINGYLGISPGKVTYARNEITDGSDVTRKEWISTPDKSHFIWLTQ